MDKETEDKNKCDLKDITIVCQSYIAQISAIIVCGVIIFHPPDMTNATVATLIGTIIGFLLSEAKNYSSYWTGTTKSSSDQQKTISTMAATASAGGTGSGQVTTAVVTPEKTTLKTEPSSTTVKVEPSKPLTEPAPDTDPLQAPPKSGE